MGSRSSAGWPKVWRPAKQGLIRLKSFSLERWRERQDLQPVNAAYLVDDLRATSPEGARTDAGGASNDQATLALINLVADGLPEFEMVVELAWHHQRLGWRFPSELMAASLANGRDPPTTKPRRPPSNQDLVGSGARKRTKIFAVPSCHVKYGP